MGQFADRFIEALSTLEEGRTSDAIVALFAEDAKLSNPLVTYAEGQTGSARSFWTQYRDAFESVTSSFRHVVETEDAALLEWRSEGVIDGKPFGYDGVSVLDLSGGQIVAFRAYFDPGRLQIHAGASRADDASKAPGNDAEKAGSQATATDAEQTDNPLVDAQRDAAKQRAAGGYS